MNTSKDWLARLMRERRVTPYGAAKLIGITADAAYHYANGRRAFDAFTATRVAELLSVEPVLVIASAEAERAKGVERRAYWEKVMQGLASVAVLSFLVMLVSDSPSLAYPTETDQGSVYYVKYALIQIAYLFQGFTLVMFAYILAFPPHRRHTHRP